jgi:prephenate dehydrogenase
MRFGKITIIGLGLIGGSLAWALKKSGGVGRIIGVDTDPRTIEIALQKGIIDKGYKSIEGSVYDCDVVVISTYVSTITKIAKTLKVSASTIVTDTGSVKANIVKDIEQSCDLSFIGSHPIAGTEKSGVQNLKHGLFKNKITIITPTKKTAEQAVEKVTGLWRLADSRVIEMEPDLHDEIFARVSHLPHAVAFGLVSSILQKDRSFLDYSGGGLKDFSRIAESSPDMWADIFISNRDQVIAAIEGFKDSLSSIEKSIADGDKKSLKKILQGASDIKKSAG